jgi:acetate---CoA ligase (ADP-forming)
MATAPVVFAENLDEFLNPRSFALIGVSATPGRPGYSLFQKVRAKMAANGGKVLPVNPHVGEIDGVRCYARLADIRESIDVAVIMVADVIPALEECVAAGVKFVIIFSAGFAEIGAEGEALQEKIEAIARRAGVRLFGPNTNVNAFETFREFTGPKIALVTQSGHQGRPIVQGQEFGVGFSYWVPTGNEVDLESADFFRYFADDPATGVIAAYIEGFKNGEKLKRAADLAARRRKPIVVVKVGRSAAGERMALAHTGHLTGSDAVHDAVFRQFGMIRVGDLDELLETAALFARLPKPVGERVCVYAISGGTGALMADWLGSRKLAMPELAAETQARLREFIPPYLTVRNPVDNGAAVLTQGHGAKILDILMSDRSTDLVVIPITGVLPPISDIMAKEIADACGRGGKPIVVVWSSPKIDEPAFRILVEARVPIFRSIRNCAKALEAYFRFHRFADGYRSPYDAKPLVSLAGDRELEEAFSGRGALSEADSKRIVARYGVPITREEIATTADDAARAASEIGFPVAMKVSSKDIAHKSDAGLVMLGVAGEEAVRAAFDALGQAARKRFPEAEIDGVLVQEMVTGGREVIVGLSSDPQFGPVVMFGLGGTFVETLGDVSLRTLPITRPEAEGMVREIRGFEMLEGVRGGRPADVDAIVDAILRVASLGADFGDRISELDINPLMVFERGRGVRAADALLIRR